MDHSRVKRAASLALGAFLACSLGLPAQQSSPLDIKQQEQNRTEQQERERREAARKAEQRYAYEDFLEEVNQIITPEELDAFRNLSINEERESAIEIFWGSRDPTPDTVENEFRDEHYRRIAYANQRFSSGIPGWKTDRGRIYIIWGPPDEIESHPAGGPYQRPAWEGGGQTSTHAFEQWRYRHLDGVGQDIILEFVDPSGSGEFRLTMDPSEKDALLHVPGAGPSESEILGHSSKVARFTRTDGTHLPAPLGGTPERMNIFERMRIHVGVQRPPARFKHLEQVVTSRVLRDQIQFSHRFDFLRITGNSVLVPITVQIPNREMHFVARQGVHSATLEMYARISTLSGRTVQVFEDVIQRDVPESLFRAALAGQSIYQKAVPLHPGLYQLNVVIKDVNSGDLGTLSVRLPVEHFEEGQLASSTLILADRIEPVPAGHIGLGPFVIGSSKVRPRINQPFTTAEHLGVYLQVYNLRLDPSSGKSSATVSYRITRDGELSWQHSASNADLGQHGSQITLEKLIPLRASAPGNYTVEVVVTDLLGQDSARHQATFTVR